MTGVRTAVLVFFALTCWGISAKAIEAPAIGKQVPLEASYAVFVSNPGLAVTNLTAILDRFKALNPEIDLKKQGEKMVPMVGVNLLTPDGMAAFGIDPAGTSVLFQANTPEGLAIAIALKDPALFRTKLMAVFEKTGAPAPKPVKKAGIEIFPIENNFLGLKGSYAVFQGGASRKGPKEGSVLAFFAKGKKLSADPMFKQAATFIPAETQVWMYLNMKRVAKLVDEGMASAQQRIGKNVDKARRKEIEAELRQVRDEQRKVFKLLGFVESVAWGMTLKPDAVDQVVYLGSTPAGMKIISKLLPAQSAAPAFHQGLAGSSILSAWTSLSIADLVRQFESAPVGDGRTLKQDMREMETQLKQNAKIDLYKDLLANFPGPYGLYLLTPAPLSAEAKASPNLEQQVLGMLRVAFLTQLADPARIDAILKMVSAMAIAAGKKVETVTVENTTLSVLKPEPGVELTWGVKGNTLVLALGANTAETLLKAVPDKAWPPKATAGLVGAGQLDFSVLTEAMSSAVAGGIGGAEAAQFRMGIWPMVQQVLAKFGKLTFSGQLVPKGYLATGSLSFH